MAKSKIGRITHFFDKIGVAVVELDKPLSMGDTVSVEGSTTNFKQKVESMQIDKDKIIKAKKGQSVGIKVNDRVRVNDIVYKE